MVNFRRFVAFFDRMLDCSLFIFNIKALIKILTTLELNSFVGPFALVGLIKTFRILIFAFKLIKGTFFWEQEILVSELDFWNKIYN